MSDIIARGMAAKSLRQRIEIIAGARTITQNGTLATFTTNGAGADGLVWPGPSFLNVKRRIPIGAIIGAPAGAFYDRIKLGFTNWFQGAGVNLTTTASAASGATSLTSVASTAGVKPGHNITGTGIQAGTKITAVAAGALTISQPTTAIISAGSITIQSTPGFYGSNTGEVAQTGGSIQLAVGVRPVFGSTAYAPIPVTFAGADSGTIPQGTTLYTDWIPGRFVPGQDMEVITSVFWPTGVHLYASHITRADLGEAISSQTAITAPPFGSAIDFSWQANPTWPAYTAGYTYGPANVIGSCEAVRDSQRSFITLGDSTGAGTSDGYAFRGTQFVFLGNANGFAGPAARMANAIGVAHMNASQAGKRLSGLLQSWQLTSTLMAGGPTHVILQLGVNDIAAGTNLATMQANWIAAVNMIQESGYKVIACTLTTMTTTTDNGATTANQTPTSGFAVGGVGQLFNDWLRTTGAPTYTNGRILDFADATMSARNSQVWRTDITPFADWGGYLARLTWVAGSGGTNGTYVITSTGGGATTPAQITVTVAGGAISSVVVDSVGVGMTSAPSFSTASITGLTGGSFTATARALTTGVHFNSMTGLTGATLTALGATQTGGNTVDANGTIATALAAQFAAALAA